MDTTKFLSSSKLMVERIISLGNLDHKIVLQLDNATYHRNFPSDDPLSSVISKYPRKHCDGTISPSTIDYLRKWKLKPEDKSDDWWVLITKTLQRSKKSSQDQIVQISAEENRIKEHKRLIRYFFKTSSHVRDRKTKVEMVISELSHKYADELYYPIEVLWGPRGHSELAEIEFSWNFMKHWVKKMNPTHALQTRQLIRLAGTLDSTNGTSWRHRVILAFECFWKFGYFSPGLMRNLYKNKKLVLRKWNNRFEDITSDYPFTEDGYKLFVNDYKATIADQLTWVEIQKALSNSSTG